MTNEVDDIREIIHVGDLFAHKFNIGDGDKVQYVQVIEVMKNKVKVDYVDVPYNYDFSKKELLPRDVEVIKEDGKVINVTFSYVRNIRKSVSDSNFYISHCNANFYLVK